MKDHCYLKAEGEGNDILQIQYLFATICKLIEEGKVLS